MTSLCGARRMTDIIQLLPDSVANQIAAGEVIQRPASVIKELVENAVDAEAMTIHVLVVDAGRTSIQVIDDGKGMSETDARLAFERHATSKIRKAEDLFALHTMGFRGEALASIAAVAQVELQTRTASDEIGTLVSVSGSKVVGQEPTSCPVGSNFKVENLFFNVPARRKFLKTNATELNNILTAFERIVLVYPEINFTMHSNGVELMNLKAGSLRQRIADVFGRQYGQDLIPVDVNTAMCRIYGFVAKPEQARKKGGCDYLFVNGRYMKHPYFHKAVITAYDRLIQEGMQIPYFLYFDINPADIDVNIHPTKTEIKFENEQAIWQILMAAVRDAIGKFCEVPTIDFDTVGRPEIPVYDPERPIAPPQPHYNPDYNPFKSAPSSPKSPVPSDWQKLYDSLSSGSVQRPSDHLPTDLFEFSETPSVIIRILYEKYMEQQRAMTSESQKLLFPETIQFSASDAVVLGSILPTLSGLGFDLSDLGGNTYAINGIPTGIEGIDPVMLLQRMVADVLEKGRGVADEINATVALSLARSAAIPYGQILNNEEMENLVNELFTCSNVNYTPDGKAVLSILPQSDIEHLLG